MASASTAPARRGLGLLALGLILLGLGVVLAWGLNSRVPAPASPPAVTPASALAEAPPPPPEADEDGILALRPTAATLLRLAGEARIFVLVFPDLNAQAATMNRVAALVEKAGFARDRLASTEELATAIAASGDTAATWYLAHDYSAGDLARFFALAGSGAAPGLSPAEAWLGTQYARLRALAGNDFALLTLTGDTSVADEAMRAAVLRHEIAHGHFFTRPGFAARTLAIWREEMTTAERDAFGRHLAREGYDTANDTLVANEAMAYLAFTPDPRLFRPEALGLSPERAAALRALYQAAAR